MMSRLSLAFFALLLNAAAAAQGQQDGSDWLASPPAREFRARVAQLALIHGDSRGIDLHGLLVTARRVGDAKSECSEVEVVVLAENKEVLREQRQACRGGPP